MLPILTVLLVIFLTPGQSKRLADSLRPDIVIDAGQNQQIKAFKSFKTSLLLESNDTTKFDQLNWFTLGRPKLLFSTFDYSTNNSTCSSNFTAHIQTRLDEKEKELVVRAVRDKYNAEIVPSQIIFLAPSRLACQFNVGDLKFSGQANDLTIDPIRVEFKIRSCAESNALAKKVADKRDKLDIEMNCQFSINSYNLTKQRPNSLIVEKDYIEHLLSRLMNVNSNFVYATRPQLLALALDAYEQLRFDGLSQTGFTERFVSEFIKQFGKSVDELVPFDEALGSLSLFKWPKKMSLKKLRRYVGKLFRVKLNIIQPRLQASTSFSALGLDKLTNLVRTESPKWMQANWSLDQQVDFMNRCEFDTIKWKRHGNKLLPEYLKAVKIVRSEPKSFQMITGSPRTLEFSRIILKYVLGSLHNLNSSLTNTDIKHILSKSSSDLLNTTNQNHNDIERLKLENTALRVNLNELSSLISKNMSSRMNEIQNQLANISRQNEEQRQVLEKRLVKVKENSESRYSSLIKIMKQLGDNSENLAVVLSQMGTEMIERNATIEDSEARKELKALNQSLSQRLDSVEVTMSYLNQRHSSLLDMRKEDTRKRDNLRALVSRLNIKLLKSSIDTKSRFDSVIRTINNRPRLTVRKGFWALKRADTVGCSRFESRILRAKFSQEFLEPPVVFYSIKSYRQGARTKRFASYKINNELISNSGLSAHIFFFNCVPFQEIILEYIAIGY